MNCRGRTGPAPARGQEPAAPCVPPGCECAAVRRPRRRSRSDGGKGAPRRPAAVCPTHTLSRLPCVRPTASERAHIGPARPRRPLPGSQAARPRPRPPPARSRPTAPPAAAGAGAASPPPPLAAARSGPLRHLRSRPIDPARCAVGSEAHGPPSRACFARSARVVPLVPTLLRRAARSSPVVTGRTERRKIEGAGSRHRWALETPGRVAAGAPTPPLSRGSAARPARARSQRRVQTWLQALQDAFPSYSISSMRT